MKSLDTISEDLFNKIRGRFPSVTIGDENGKLTNDPKLARFYDFDYKKGNDNLGKVSISVSEESLDIMYAQSFMEDQDEVTKQNWYEFLREIRAFAKKRLLKFDVRDITKSNLDRRDYQFLSQNRNKTMSESRLWGTGRVSYQNIGSARLNIRHRSSINQEQAAARTRNIDKIFIESPEGERFRYPYRHLAGARAMARHVAEGGTPFDDFGKHVIGLSEELNNLKKFKTYVNRSAVMAEGLSQYMDVIEGRAKDVKRELESIQKSNGYANIIENYETVVLEEVPDDVKTNWIDELTIRQFNEDLKDIFPYIYRLVGEATQPEEITSDTVDSALEESDDEKDTLAELPADSNTEEKEAELPITEFILSHYDRETGAWPRGETAVLTGVEKDYGESFIEPAKQFIERVNQTFEQYSETAEAKTHISLSGVETSMDPSDDDYEINYGKHGAAAKDIKEQDNEKSEGCGCDDDEEAERDTDEDFERLKNLAGL